MTTSIVVVGFIRGQKVISWHIPLLDSAPTNRNHCLRWLVDEADSCADDDPLNEVGDALIERERETDVQIDVVVNDEGADRENADECAVV
jgi:hypothetical protein